VEKAAGKGQVEATAAAEGGGGQVEQRKRSSKIEAPQTTAGRRGEMGAPTEGFGGQEKGGGGNETKSPELLFAAD